MVYLCPPLLIIIIHLLYVYITLTNNYLAFFIYQLIILWTISINWHRWLLLNNHISKYNSFILVLYRRYINYVSVWPQLFGIFLRHWWLITLLNTMRMLTNFLIYSAFVISTCDHAPIAFNMNCLQFDAFLRTQDNITVFTVYRWDADNLDQMKLELNNKIGDLYECINEM